MIRVLFLGDIVGRAARHEVIEKAPVLRDEYKLDFLVVNCENAAGGFGVTPKICGALFGADGSSVTKCLKSNSRHLVMLPGLHPRSGSCEPR